jgi:hypothetical protein
MPERNSRLPPDRKTPFQKVWRVADEQSVPEFSIILFLILSNGKVIRNKEYTINKATI